LATMVAIWARNIRCAESMLITLGGLTDRFNKYIIFFLYHKYYIYHAM
jgi:hypothetical protein